MSSAIFQWPYDAKCVHICTEKQQPYLDTMNVCIWGPAISVANDRAAYKKVLHIVCTRSPHHPRFHVTQAETKKKAGTKGSASPKQEIRQENLRQGLYPQVNTSPQQPSPNLHLSPLRSLPPSHHIPISLYCSASFPHVPFILSVHLDLYALHHFGTKHLKVKDSMFHCKSHIFILLHTLAMGPSFIFI